MVFDVARVTTFSRNPFLFSSYAHQNIHKTSDAIINSLDLRQLAYCVSSVPYAFCGNGILGETCYALFYDGWQRPCLRKNRLLRLAIHVSFVSPWLSFFKIHFYLATLLTRLSILSKLNFLHSKIWATCTDAK
jgi:hypothetical protein